MWCKFPSDWCSPLRAKSVWVALPWKDSYSSLPKFNTVRYELYSDAFGQTKRSTDHCGEISYDPYFTVPINLFDLQDIELILHAHNTMETRSDSIEQTMSKVGPAFVKVKLQTFCIHVIASCYCRVRKHPSPKCWFTIRILRIIQCLSITFGNQKILLRYYLIISHQHMANVK